MADRPTVPAPARRLKQAPIIAIAGFPRCGSSLICQMLAASGVKVYGEYPSYEAYSYGADSLTGFEEWRSNPNRVVKVLDMMLKYGFPPPEVPVKFIRLRRDLRQQVRSNAKFIEACGGPRMGRPGRREYEASLRRDNGLLDVGLGEVGLVHHIRFDELLRAPRKIMIGVTEFLEIDCDVNIDRAVRQVVARDPECLTELLELELLARGGLVE